MFLRKLLLHGRKKLYLTQIHSFTPLKESLTMSDRGKGKAKVTSRKRKKSQSSTDSATSSYAKISLSDKDKEDQLLPSTNVEKFPNLYCEFRFPTFLKRKLNQEKKLDIPSDLRQSIELRIEGLGLSFVDRELAKVNESWVREFYCNFYTPTLNSIHLRGGQILVTEADIEDALHCQPKASDTDAFMQTEVEMHCLTYDYDALRSIVAEPDSPWELDANKTKPKGMMFEYLTREARVWQQILAHYVMPTTHFTEISVDMLVLLRCIMEGKELYFPCLIRKYMWRAHVKGTLPFPALIIEMAQRASVPWLPDDELPPPIHGKERLLPWGTWVYDRLALRRSRARSAAAASGPPSSSATASGPSSSSAAAGPTAPSTAASQPPLPPSSAPQPTYRLVQHLIERMDRSERRNERCFRRVIQMLASLGAVIPPDSDTSDHSEEEADHGEEARQAEAPPEIQASTQPQPDSLVASGTMLHSKCGEVDVVGGNVILGDNFRLQLSCFILSYFSIRTLYYYIYQPSWILCFTLCILHLWFVSIF